MLLLDTEIPRNHNYDLPPEWWRELNALKGTAIDAGKFPILAAHWRGPLIVGGKLACNFNSPLVSKFKTLPVVDIEGPSR